MVNSAVLMPLLLAVALFVGIAFKAKSVLLGAVGGISIFSYVAVKSNDPLFLGYYILLMFFMVMGTSVYLVKTQMGDTA